MARLYVCKKSFYVDNYDGDGFLIEDDGIVIEEGTVYTLDESGYMIVGGKDHVHLDAVKGNTWLEISKNMFSTYFEKLTKSKSSQDDRKGVDV